MSTLNVRDNWNGIDYQLSTTNGAKGVTMSLVRSDPEGGAFISVHWNMDPQTARALAVDLINRADDIDKRKGE